MVHGIYMNMNNKHSDEMPIILIIIRHLFTCENKKKLRMFETKTDENERRIQLLANIHRTKTELV